MEHFGLKEKFMSGAISIAVDGALYNMMNNFPEFNGIESRCSTHTAR